MYENNVMITNEIIRELYTRIINSYIKMNPYLRNISYIYIYTQHMRSRVETRRDTHTHTRSEKDVSPLC